MKPRYLLAGLCAFVFAVSPAAAAQQISMRSVRNLANKQATREEIAVDASGHKVACGQNGRLTATCRFRMMNATDSDGNNYDCSMYVKYKLHANGYIYSRMALDLCTQ